MRLDAWAASGEQDTDFDYEKSDLLGLLMRIEHDLYLFLLTSPTLKPMWWTMYEHY